ncbi:MAG: hypothetical protein E7176_00905 [Erysipelotrichaceae bacterium]|nr:hypothetical protein [Erysipelotrichaceae bacterium]
MKRYLLYTTKLILVSIIIGLAIALFQFLAHELIYLSTKLLASNWIYATLIILVALIIYTGLFFVNRKFDGYYGSGIPRIEAYYHGWHTFNPYLMLVMIFINSLFGFFTGFLLGSEGPSISISTSIGMIGNKALKQKDTEFEASAGSAGFACAFASPLAGFCHLIEENKNVISLKLILKGLLVIGFSFVVSYLVYPHNLLPFFEVEALPFNYYYLLIILGVIIALIAKAYSVIIVKIKSLDTKFHFMHILTPLLLVGFMILRRFCPILCGNGSNSLQLDVIDYSLVAIIGILLFRLAFVGFSSSAYTSGGLVLPMLAVGALASFILVKIYSFIDSSILEYTALFVICGMVSTFGAVTKCPLTAFILGLKCSSFNIVVWPLTLVVLLTAAISYFFKYSSIYHELEKNIPGYGLVH